MICDLCDKDQQNICERTFHFVKPINECLMRKAQENRKIIEELEHLKAVIRFNGLYNEQIEDLIDIEIKGWKGENK